MELYNKILGSLYGGAVGDALGYPIEFLTKENIVSKFGKEGLKEFVPGPNGIAKISDDTQMTLFTANGLLFGITRVAVHGGLGASYADYIKGAYVEWFKLQKGISYKSFFHTCWIVDIAGFEQQRAPGNTCMEALENIENGQPVVNNSKGSGGIMRIAPIGLLQNCFSNDNFTEFIIRLSVDVAKITHCHPLGYQSAALTAYIIHKLLKAENVDADLIQKIALEGVDTLLTMYPEDTHYIGLLRDIIYKARRFADSSAPDADIGCLGQGWVAEEALAISLGCAFRYHHDFDRAIIASVNHSGDSDTTGTVTGNIVGAIVGYSGIPARFKHNLEFSSVIRQLAEDLRNPLPETETLKQAWFSKYVYIEAPLERNDI